MPRKWTLLLITQLLLVAGSIRATSGLPTPKTRQFNQDQEGTNGLTTEVKVEIRVEGHVKLNDHGLPSVKGGILDSMPFKNATHPLLADGEGSTYTQHTTIGDTVVDHTVIHKAAVTMVQHVQCAQATVKIRLSDRKEVGSDPEVPNLGGGCNGGIDVGLPPGIIPPGQGLPAVITETQIVAATATASYIQQAPSPSPRPSLPPPPLRPKTSKSKKKKKKKPKKPYSTATKTNITHTKVAIPTVINPFTTNRPGQPARVTTSTTSSVSKTVTQVESTQAATNVGLVGFEKDILSHHNTWRQQYKAKALEWDPKLADEAQKWAQNCKWDHNPNLKTLKALDNLDSAANSEGTAKLSGEDVLQHWVVGSAQYPERDGYNPNSPVASHFTQVVWKGTTHVGCATLSCNLPQYQSSWWPAAFAVCVYSPAGNVAGQFAENVSV